jgi:uncharacterized YigZ family protein
MNTIKTKASIRYEISKSIFIGHTKPIKTKEESLSFFEEIKAEHKNATHNVPAYIIGAKQEQAYASDDNEPGGTAGTPILSYLYSQTLTNLIVVATRYFGGIKLGTGGLVRAYTQVARMAVEASEIIPLITTEEIRLKIEYSFLDKIKVFEKQGLLQITDINYANSILLTLEIDRKKKQEIYNILDEVFAGKLSKLVQN